MSLVDEAFAALAKRGFSEVYHRTEFKAYRELEDGSTQVVTIEIFDAGPDSRSDLRYHCSATAEDGSHSLGNPAASVDEALAIVHWWVLGRGVGEPLIPDDEEAPPTSP